MRFKILFITLGSFLIISSNLNAIEFKEGNWAIEMQMEMEGMTMPMAPVTIEQCLSKKDMVPAQQGPESKCKVSKQKVKGSTVSWSVKCPESKGTGSITYKNKNLSGKMNVVVTGAARSMKMSYKMNGYYKGPCKK